MQFHIILTAEASGIGIACLTARYFGCNIVFAKKSSSKNMGDDTYTSLVRSFTRGSVFEYRVDKRFLTKGQRVLIIDDFLADGQAAHSLIDLVHQAGAEVAGIGIAIEKGFQPGGQFIRNMGYHLESLAIVESMEVEPKKINFRK